MNKLEKIIDKVICKAIDSECKEQTELLKDLADTLNDCEQLIYGAAAMGFFSESHESGQTHKALCRKFERFDGQFGSSNER